jgi:excisionase family DNA binding protein
MPHEQAEQQRQQLLANLFGVDVPAGLSSQLLRTSDVAALFQVSERTVSDWARRGRIPSVRTPGGHRRYPAEEIRRIMEEADWGDPRVPMTPSSRTDRG